MSEAYLCLGGNLGNCITTFNNVCTHIQQSAKLVAQSSVYQSLAWGMNNAPDFYNQIIKLQTQLSVEELMQFVLSVEKTLGRERGALLTGYQSRIIDIDILFYNAGVLKTDTLEIPHPHMHLRNFVLQPLAEIAPNYIHPVLKKSIIELLKLCPDKGEVKKLVHAA